MEIYKATNLTNGKLYIGQTTINTDHRRKGHFREAKKKGPLTYFHNALNKYGKECFKFEVIDTAKTIGELNLKEQKWIKYYDATNRIIGYNLDSGGSNTIKSESTRAKIGVETKKDWENPEIAKRMREGLVKATDRWVNICENNRVEVTCKNCGDKLLLPPHMAKDRQYCSRSCSATHKNVGLEVANKNRIERLSIRNNEIKNIADSWYLQNDINNYKSLMSIIKDSYGLKDNRSIIKAITGGGTSKTALKNYFSQGD